MSEEKSYERTVLFQTDFFEVVSIQWRSSSHSPMHDHGWSQCLVLVEDGIFENRLDLGIKEEVRLLETGQVLATPVGARHAMSCKSKTGKTLHVYTPRIQALGEAGRFTPFDLGELKSDLALGEGVSVERLRELLQSCTERAISTHSPYFMNQLFSGVLPQMLMAQDFLARTRTILATFEASPVHSNMELAVIQALGALTGWGEGVSGIAVPGGSAANFMAMHCARQKQFPNFKRSGLDGRALKIFVSREAHYSFQKASVVLGMGLDNLVAVPTDARGRMSPSALEELVRHHVERGAVPLACAATAGTMVLGAFDPIAELGDVCRRHGLWLHVDAAWGGPAMFSPRLRPLLNGLAQADSLTFDAHKLFGAALTSSFFLTRHPDILVQANDVSGGDYLFHDGDTTLDRGKMSWQCGRSGDAASFWSVWKSVGTEGLGQFVDRLLNVRDELVAWIQTQDRLELVADPEYLNVCVRVKSPRDPFDQDWAREVRERMKNNDQAFVNYARDEAGSFLRLILANPYLQFEHARQILRWALEVR